jgi:hypothetical protein
MDQPALPTPRLLTALHFDLENPRYGKRASEVKSEEQALDLIVSDFLVDDLLSSISANGFFEGEPLIAKAREDGELEVIEGNRRLASLLILANDERATNQRKRHEIFAGKMRENGHAIPREVPVIVVEGKEQASTVLAYLGTKHIVGPSEWDSYAKAKWMAQMMAETDLTLQRIREMIGDVGGLVDRMLEGYYVIEQTRDSGLFSTGQSYVRGRGSNPDFPFSWVYTALGYAGIRRFLGIQEKSETAPNPIPPESVQEAGALFEMIFGNRLAEKPPVIGESRDLSRLAKALVVPAMASRLREGTPLVKVEEESKPISERLASLVDEAKQRLSTANGILTLGGITLEQANDLEMPSQQTFAAAKSLRDTLRKIRDTHLDDEDE